jgi:hypothetical protein
MNVFRIIFIIILSLIIGLVTLLLLPVILLYAGIKIIGGMASKIN